MSDHTLIDFLAPLTRLFDENIRTISVEPPQKGWGQFVGAESHTNQVGLYGTSAGILVKTLSNPTAHIDTGVVEYVRQLWNNRSDPNDKYFHQTVRLAFFAMALARSADNTLAEIRSAATGELISRQFSDGGWGDWWQSERASATAARLEATAWAILAIERVADDRNRANLLRAGLFLQSQVLGYQNIEKSVDPILLSAIVRALPQGQIDKRVRAAAISVLRHARPQDDIKIYFFDYVIGQHGSSQVKRDFLCVPDFLAYCLLSSSLDFGNAFSIGAIFIQLAHWRAVEHLKSLTLSVPFRHHGSRYPATVDQAFLALAVEAASKRETKFSGFFRIAKAVYNYLEKSWLIRLIFPIFVVTLLTTVAKDPNNIWQLYGFVATNRSVELKAWVEHYSSLIQFMALGIGFFVGNPLIVNIMSFLKRRLRF